MTTILALAAEGTIEPVIANALPLSRAKRGALELIAGGSIAGKIVLRCDQAHLLRKSSGVAVRRAERRMQLDCWLRYRSGDFREAGSNQGGEDVAKVALRVSP